MSEITTQPDADGTVQWNVYPAGDHWARIDESIAGKNTWDYIFTGAVDKIDYFLFPPDGPLKMDVITEVWIDLYINASDAGTVPGLRIRLYVVAVLKKSSTWNVDTGGAWHVLRCTVTGLNLTRAEYNDLRVELTSTNGQFGLIPVMDP